LTFLEAKALLKAQPNTPELYHVGWCVEAKVTMGEVHDQMDAQEGSFLLADHDE
jgi:hypothetical protein